jgi:hypothetical protein
MAAFQTTTTQAQATGDLSSYYAAPGSIDSTQEMYHVFVRFVRFGKGHRTPTEVLKMDSRTFQKFCRDAGLVDNVLNSTRIDLIFTKLTSRDPRTQKKSKNIDFDGFISSLQECAVVLNTPYLTVQNHITNSNVSPSLGGSKRATQLTSILNTNNIINSPFTVRRANQNDLDSVVSLRIAFALEQDASMNINSATVKQGVSAGLVESGSAGLLQPRYYVASVNENEIIGMIGIRPEWNDMAGNCTWNITSMYVERSYQDQNINYKMLKEGVMEDAVVLNVSTLSLNIPRNNERLINFFHRDMQFKIPSNNVNMIKQVSLGLPVMHKGNDRTSNIGTASKESSAREKGIQWS